MAFSYVKINFILRANAEVGFQPEAEHLPVEVEDTLEVKEAKEHFQAGFEAMKARLAQAEKDRLENKVATASSPNLHLA